MRILTIGATTTMNSENPYQASEDPIDLTPIDGPLPTSAYISAGCSGILVFAGAIFVGGAVILMYAPVLARMAAVTLLILLFVATLLGAVSAWETIRLVEKKREKLRREREQPPPD